MPQVMRRHHHRLQHRQRLAPPSAVGLLALVALAAAGALAAGCSSSPSHPAASSTSKTTSKSTQATTATTATTATAPVVQSTGPLTLGAPIPVPITANEVTAAEAPNGAVFVSSQDPATTTPTVVWVIDGNGPAAIAEHMPGGVAALAADATNLYVASYSTVTAFSRSTGNQDGQWSLPPISTANTSNDDLVSLSASGGHVLVMIAQGNTELIYRFSPGSVSAPTLIAQGSSAAFGPDGSVYYASSANHLVELSGAGVTTVGPALVDAPNGSGGGVQFVTVVAGGVVWVSEPAGQGLDTQFSEYDATTLALEGTHSGSDTEQIVGTSDGTLVLSPPDAATACSSTSASSGGSCLARVSAAGTFTDGVGVGLAIALLGPDPAVIVNAPTPTAFELEPIT